MTFSDHDKPAGPAGEVVRETQRRIGGHGATRVELLVDDDPSLPAMLEKTCTAMSQLELAFSFLGTSGYWHLRMTRRIR